MTSTPLSKKAVQLKKTAIALFNKFGIKRVSIEEICKTAGVSKMTFYKYYKNKTELLNVILHDMMDAEVNEFARLDQLEIPFREKMEGVLRFDLDMMNSWSPEFIADMDTPELQHLMAQHGAEGMRRTIGFIEKAQRNNEIRQDLSIAFVGYLFEQFFKMYLDPELVKIFSTPQERLEQLFHWFFKSLDPGS